MSAMLSTLAPLLPAYLLGSFSFAWLAGRLCGVDLRSAGSGNLGATNAGRVLGGRWFAFVFLGDLLKGLLPVLATSWLLPEAPHAPLIAAIGAVLGHVFTCFHGFKGGKAVATSLGVLIGLLPLAAAVCAAVWILCWLIAVLACRQARSAAVGPASILAAITLPIAHLLLTETPWQGDALPLTVFACLLAALVLWRHRSNLRALLRRPRA